MLNLKSPPSIEVVVEVAVEAEVEAVVEVAVKATAMGATQTRRTRPTLKGRLPPLQTNPNTGGQSIPTFQLASGRGVAYIINSGGELTSVRNRRRAHGKTSSLLKTNEVLTSSGTPSILNF